MDTSLTSALGRAIALWSQGKSIPMTLAAELMAEGYDIPSLERRHRK
ncbi:MAG: hypothetical protein J0I48_10645 [Devosia sp.]|nr:hypothetical protein [Devosia sp. 66-22]MBN9346639.1 hypothetical protein [Devosia sp.]